MPKQIHSMMPTILSLYSQIWRHLSINRKKQFIYLLILVVLVAFFEVVSIGAVMPFLGVVISPNKVLSSDIARPIVELIGVTTPRDAIVFMATIFGILSICTACLRALLLWQQTKISFEVGSEFSKKAYYRCLMQPYQIQITKNTSELIAGITTKAGGIVGNTLYPALIIISSILITLSIFSGLLYLNPLVAVSTAACFGFIYFFIMSLSRPKLMRCSAQISKDNNQVLKILQEGFGGVRDVLLEGSQIAHANKFANIENRLRASLATAHILSTAPKYAVEAIGMIFIAGVVVFQVISGGEVEELIPTLGVFALAAQRLLPVLQQAYSAWSTVKGGQSSAEDVMSMLNQDVIRTSDDKYGAQLIFSSQVTLKNISFKYKNQGPYVLQDLSFAIKKGGRYGIIGETGCGKSTCLDLIMGLLSPTSGQLMVDDEVITLANSSLWMRHVAHVPQTVFLSDASIVENITLDNLGEEIDNEKLESAIEGAQLFQVISKMPDGLNTVVGERGIGLSGGQRQRIGIARALYKNADFLVFDEATSALDGNTEEAVMEAIQMLNKNLTIIIVAHRMTTLKGCDQIIELSAGKVSRFGTYEEIMGIA